jgi:dihydrofolate synthase/folylpolyglutamate synthase
LVLAIAPSVPASQRWTWTDLAPWAERHGAKRRKKTAQVLFEPDFERALKLGEEGAETVLVTGSFHTVGDAMGRVPGAAPVT